MKKIMIFLIIIFCSQLLVYSQNIFTIVSDQPHPLNVHAGNDTSIVMNQNVQLGGLPAAEFGYGAYVFNWSPGTGLDDPSISNPIATPISDMTYTLTVIDSLGCMDVDSITILVTNTSVYDENFLKQLNLFPNPNDGSFYLSFSDKLICSTYVQIYNIAGSMILSTQIPITNKTNHLIKLEGAPAGYYYVKIGDAFNSVNKSFVIIK